MPNSQGLDFQIQRKTIAQKQVSIFQQHLGIKKLLTGFISVEFESTDS